MRKTLCAPEPSWKSLPIKRILFTEICKIKIYLEQRRFSVTKEKQQTSNNDFNDCDDQELIEKKELECGTQNDDDQIALLCIDERQKLIPVTI